MKYKFTKAEQETVINFDNELDTASIYTHDSRLIKKLRELRKQYPEQFILEHREHGSVTYTIPKRCVGIRPPYSKKRREQQRQEAKENGLPFMDDRGNDDPDCESTTEKPAVLAELRDRAGRIPPMTHRDEEVAL